MTKRRAIIIGIAAMVMSLMPTTLVAAEAAFNRPRTDASNSASTEPGWPFTTDAVGLPVEPTEAGVYVALGDSVAAGVGLSSTDATADSACGVTTEAYSSLVATTLDKSYKNYACSGATAGDLVTEQHLSGSSRDIEPQLDTAFANGTPSLITITAGANDTYWPYFIRKCYVSECGTGVDRVTATALLSALRLKLEYALSDISIRSNAEPPQVILTGYYNPLSSACLNLQSKVTAVELSWLNRQTEALNQVIADAVDTYSSFASFAPVSFARHELCSGDPWVQGLQDKSPFHPTANGQKAIAEAVLEQVDEDAF